MTQDNVTSLRPLTIMEQLADAYSEGCLQVSYETVTYCFYFNQGQLFYATHSIDPFERLDRHLKSLSSTIPLLTADVQEKVRSQFGNTPTFDADQPLEYQAICWLANHHYLLLKDITILLDRLIQEVIFSCLSIPEVIYQKFSENHLEVLHRFDTRSLLQQTCDKITQWKTYLPHIRSPYQRPYFFINNYAEQKLSWEQRNQLGNLLKGYNFAQLAVLMNQNELDIIKRIYPLVVNGAILVRDPQSPFNQLPLISSQSLAQPTSKSQSHWEEEEDLTSENLTKQKRNQKQYKIVCVDDSPTLLQEIKRLLGDDQFLVVMINDPLKALRSILKEQPDLILLDVGMPNIDGYQLCSLIRKHPLFKGTPIVMVTGKTGVINRAKAKILGATDYMTKPFTQADLMKMVFRHLS